MFAFRSLLQLRNKVSPLRFDVVDVVGPAHSDEGGTEKGSAPQNGRYNGRSNHDGEDKGSFFPLRSLRSAGIFFAPGPADFPVLRAGQATVRHKMLSLQYRIVIFFNRKS